MPTEVKGAVELRKALRKFAPDLAKETQKEIANLLKPITQHARSFIPSTAPLSGWAKESNGRFPEWDSSEAKRGIGYKTTPSKPNRQGFRSLAQINNKSASGTIFETAGRKNPNGRPHAPKVWSYTQEKMIRSRDKNHSISNNPNAGAQFIEAINAYGPIVNANNQTGAGRRTSKMKGRAIFRAWAEDGGKTNAAVIKAIEASREKFYKAVGYN